MNFLFGVCVGLIVAAGLYLLYKIFFRSEEDHLLEGEDWP